LRHFTTDRTGADDQQMRRQARIVEQRLVGEVRNVG
jgi:hypothetical protein